MEQSTSKQSGETNRRKNILFVLCLLLAGVVQPGPKALAQEKPQARRTFQGFPDLVGGLKATKGCIGVETARTTSGKNIIFAWFEDKDAVLRWYFSEMHQGVMNSFVQDYTPREPLQGVRDDVGPVMAIASITFAERPQVPGVSLPISQISIELYQPVTGGISLGGRFAPDSLKVPGLRNLTPGKD